MTYWAKQGVLLLNTCLTVEKGKAGAHIDKGWEPFTDKIIEVLAKRGYCVFMLWGKQAQRKRELIEKNTEAGTNLILEASHPSPYSADKGFFGCGHFKKANLWLWQWGQGTIDWEIV